MIPILCYANEIDWKKYDQGMALAKKQNKKIFLHFRTDWCAYCKKMEKTTFKKNTVIRFLNDHFISIKVDGDREKKITSDYRVKGFPDNWFMNEKRKIVLNLPGYLEPKALLFYLKYLHTDSYKTMTPTEYYKSGSKTK